MKKSIFAAMCCIALFASCAPEGNESNFDLSAPTTPAVNATSFDKEASVRVELYFVCQELIEIHKDFDDFRACLNEEQTSAIDNGKYDLDMAVSIVFEWWTNRSTFDIMCEVPAYDDFIPLVTLIDEYNEKYGFYW